jgi:SAM-dependent methyltransferase
MKPDKKRFVHDPEVHNKKAPQLIVPLIIDLLHPNSVIDVGCGLGTFLAVFNENGVDEILGLEGGWLDTNNLEISKDKVIIADLEKPFSYNKKFDLALCIEVAEHLSGNSADTIVNTLTGLSDVILFSAAVPGQQGQNHINEQWVEYWQEKFAKKGYVFYDEIRNKIWNNKEINWWYKQNLFLVIKQGKNVYGFKEGQPICNYIHPELFSSSRATIKKILSGRSRYKVYLKAIKDKLLSDIGFKKIG